MSEPFKKVAGRAKADEAPVERRPLRVWYVVNARGNVAMRRNFKPRRR